MKKFTDIFIPGLTLGLLCSFCENIVSIIIAIYNAKPDLNIFILSQLSPSFLVLFVNTFYLYSFPCILLVWALYVLVIHARFYATGFLAGLVLGLLVNIPYVVIRLGNYHCFLIPLDPINLSLTTLLCGISGLYVFKQRDWKIKRSDQNLNPLPEEVNPSQVENTPKSHGEYKWLLAWLLPPLILICLCGFAAVYSIQYLPFSSLADKVWCWRISQSLKQEGYTVDDVAIDRGNGNPLFSQMEIRISSVKHKDYLEYKDVILQVHQIIFENMEMPYLIAEDLGTIEVAITDYSIGMYYISVDYEIARQYQQNKMSRGDYMQHWRFY